MAEALADNSRPRGWHWPAVNSATWPALAIALTLILQLMIATNRAINWDEFYHYSQIHQFLRGDLTAPLQTFHARLFAWVTTLPGTGIDHILTIRLAMFAALCAAALNTYLIAERFAPVAVALLAALLYLSAGFVLQHGSSFRADPMAAALLTGSLAIMLRARPGPIAIIMAGLLAATATMLTIKCVLYAPAFAAIAWFRWSTAGFSRTMFLRLAAMALSFLGGFAILFWWHAMGVGSDTATAASGMASGSANKMFSIGHLLYGRQIAQAAFLAPMLTICALLVPVMLWRGRAQGPRRIALAGLWLPLCWLAVYHNTAPYFYVFMLPPVAAACAIALPVIVKRYSIAAVSVILGLSAVMIWAIEAVSPITKQQTLVRAADEIFPQPVAYFDFPAMLGKFPKANVFMTPWGSESYREHGYGGTMRGAMETQTVPLVVENSVYFSAVLHTTHPVPHFLPEDVAALRGNYVQFWGPFWVAGKHYRESQGTVTSEFLVPGDYTASGRVRVDGRSMESGQVTFINRGIHTVESLDSTATLMWGNHLKVPASPPPERPYWTAM